MLPKYSVVTVISLRSAHLHPCTAGLSSPSALLRQIRPRSADLRVCHNYSRRLAILSNRKRSEQVKQEVGVNIPAG